MASFDNLKERLLRDDREKAEATEKEGRALAEEIINAARARAAAIMEEVKPRAEKDGKEKRDRIIARAQLNDRNSLLEVKQGIIEGILKTAAEKIESMNESEYSSFIEKLLLNNAETGEEEIIFSSSCKNRVSSELIASANSKLIAGGKSGMLRMSSETRNIPSGFILKRGGLEINCSIDAQIGILRDSLEMELAELLFGGR